MSKSFYDLDYIIEISEKRLEEYTNAYQATTSKFTNIFIIYSAIAIFLAPCLQSIFLTRLPIIFYVLFSIFLILFVTSIVYTIKLLIPEKVAYLVEPKNYYTTLLQDYQNRGDKQDQIEIYLKGSYISELELAIKSNDKLFKKKGKFYYRALIFVLMSSLPYIVCLGYYFSKDNKIQKVEIVNSSELCTFDKNILVPNDNKNSNSSNSSTTTTTTTKLPNVDSSKIILSKPQMIREGSDIDSNHPGKKAR